MALQRDAKAKLNCGRTPASNEHKCLTHKTSAQEVLLEIVSKVKEEI